MFRAISEDEPRPNSIEECYIRGICTYAVTGKAYQEQKWYRLPEWPQNEGFCMVCAHAHFADRRSEWIEKSGPFFCDLADQGKSSRLPAFKVDPNQNEWVFNIDTKLRPSTDSFRYNNSPKSPLRPLTNNGQATVESHDFTENDTMVYHSNYIRYLKLCWDSHAGLVIVPDHFWFVVACQLAQHIKDFAKEYQHLFTESDEKQKLLFVVPNPDDLNLALVIEALRQKIPGINIDYFLPKFSTSTEKSQLAIASCFCEAMEAYYDYCTTMCGISKVKVMGKPEDWLTLAQHADQLSKFLVQGDCPKYLSTVAARCREIADMSPSTWQDFFKIVDCGSGADEIVAGWVVDLYSLICPIREYNSHRMNRRFRGADIKEFKDGSQVNYTNLDTDTKFRKCYGLMSSQLDDEWFLNPDFNCVILKPQSPEDRILSKFSEGEGQALKRLRKLPMGNKTDMVALLQMGYRVDTEVQKWLQEPAPSNVPSPAPHSHDERPAPKWSSYGEWKAHVERNYCTTQMVCNQCGANNSATCMCAYKRATGQ